MRSKPGPRLEKGVTLIEVLIGIMIVGIMAAAIVMLISGIFTNNRHELNRMTAIKQVENATHWIIRDAQMAQSVTLTNPPPGGSGFPLTMTWTDTNLVTHNVTYAFQGGQLQRSDTAEGTTTLVQNINTSSSLTNCQYSKPVLTFQITATTGGNNPENETRLFQAVMRAPGN